MTFPVLFDPKNEVSKLYKVVAMPSTVLVGSRRHDALHPSRLQAGLRRRVPDPGSRVAAGVTRWQQENVIDRSLCACGRGALRARRLQRRAVGQAVRARPPRRSNHVVRPRSRLELVHGARVRSARRRARRDWRGRRRLRLQLAATREAQLSYSACCRWLRCASATPACCPRIGRTCCCIPTTAAASRFKVLRSSSASSSRRNSRSPPITTSTRSIAPRSTS